MSGGVACTLYTHWNNKPSDSSLYTMSVGMPKPKVLEKQKFLRIACQGMAGEDFPFLKLLRLFGATCSATTAVRLPTLPFLHLLPLPLPQIASSSLKIISAVDMFFVWVCWLVLWGHLMQLDALAQRQLCCSWASPPGSSSSKGLVSPSSTLGTCDAFL